MNFLRLALEESVFSIGVSRPNPAVGAVVVKDGIVVGKGRTQRPGSAHAEVMALRDAGELARGAAIYVTLEPCCHYGRTPPCTKAIIDAGIKEVFYAHGDPNPVVRGNSRRVLEEAGIVVHEGVDACIAAEVDDGLEQLSGDCAGGECRCMHEDFLSGMANAVQRNAAVEASGRYVFHDIERYFEAYDYFVRNKRTFVEVKCAVSQEGFMGAVACDGSHLPVRITGENANCWNHELRSISDAVLVGAGTVLADNPSLNVRNVAGNDPVKIVWAGHHEFTAEEIERLAVFAPCLADLDSASSTNLSSLVSRLSSQESLVSRLIVFSCVPQPTLSSLVSRLELVPLTFQNFAENWTAMIDNLSARGMHRLMVEPGAGLAKQLFENGGWNRLDIWKSTDCRVDDAIAALAASDNIKEGLEFPELPRNIVAKESFMAGPDVLTVYYPA